MPPLFMADICDMRTLGAVNIDVLEPADWDKNPRTMKIIAAVAAVAAYNMSILGHK